jgi:hypothetical protein
MKPLPPNSSATVAGSTELSSKHRDFFLSILSLPPLCGRAEGTGVFVSPPFFLLRVGTHQLTTVGYIRAEPEQRGKGETESERKREKKMEEVIGIRVCSSCKQI